MVVLLEAVGLGPAEEEAYLSLLRTPARGRAELAERLGIGSEDAAGALALLEERGLIRRDAGRGLRVVPPDVALGALLLRHQTRLQRAQGAVARIVEEYRNRAVLHDSEAAVEVVNGREDVAARFLEVQSWAAKEVCSLVTGPVLAVSSEDNHVAPEAMAAGIPYRVVYDRALVEDGERPVRLETWRGMGEEIRICDGIPMKLTVVDDRVAFLPTVTDPVEEPSAIVVRESGLFDALVWVFETVWRSAVPYPAVGGEGEGPDEDERRLLSLMLAGGTDASIAKQLGVSERTVQRRVGGLADLVGARTRLQLVWKATKRGWL